MKYYAVAEIEVIDQSWVPEYIAKVTELVERAGGHYLARTARSEKIEGDRTPPQIVLLIEWPSKEAALAFYESAAYRPYRERRPRGGAERVPARARRRRDGRRHHRVMRSTAWS